MESKPSLSVLVLRRLYIKRRTSLKYDDLRGESVRRAISRPQGDDRGCFRAEEVY